MKKEVLIKDPDKIIYLRSIKRADIQLLRKWKNANADKFFYKRSISYRSQEIWYKDYIEKSGELIFMIEKIEPFEGVLTPFTGFENIPVGCIGYRYLYDRIDIFNVIIDEKFRRKGIMTRAFKLLVPEIRRNYKYLPITTMVLNDNDALEWYKKNNFSIETQYSDHYFLKLKEV